MRRHGFPCECMRTRGAHRARNDRRGPSTNSASNRAASAKNVTLTATKAPTEPRRMIASGFNVSRKQTNPISVCCLSTKGKPRILGTKRLNA